MKKLDFFIAQFLFKLTLDLSRTGHEKRHGRDGIPISLYNNIMKRPRNMIFIMYILLMLRRILFSKTRISTKNVQISCIQTAITMKTERTKDIF